MMTDETTTVEERARRAEEQDMTVTLVDNDPIVVQVYNDDSDRIHTVIPESMHCSCEDHTYRNTVCKHILRLMQDDGHIGGATREALKAERGEIQEQMADLQAQMDTLQSERTQISAALNAVDASHVADETVQDVIEGMQAEAEARSASGEGEDGSEEDEADGEFEQMVADLSGGNE